jgi:hypothetical protein
MWSSPSLAVSDMKQLIQHKEGIPVNQQSLIYNGQYMKDWLHLGDYNIRTDSTIYVREPLRGGMYHFTSGRQGFDYLPSDAADAVKNILLFNIKNFKDPHHLPSAKLKAFILQARAVLSTLHSKIQNVYVFEDIPDLKSIVLPTVDDEDSSDSEDDDMSSDE